MRKFSIKVWRDLSFYYNHYLSYEFINARSTRDSFKRNYPLSYFSRRFDKPAAKYKNGLCYWRLDNKRHRVGRPAYIYSDGGVEYWENGKEIK